MRSPTLSTSRLLVACTKGVRMRLIVAAALGAGASACAVSLAATSGWLIARAAQHPPVLTLMVAAVLVRAFGIGRGVLRYGERLAAHDGALRVVSALRQRIFQALIPLAPIGLSDAHSGDLLSQMASEVEAVQDLYVRALLPAAGAFLVGLAAVGFTAVLLPAAALTLGPRACLGRGRRAAGGSVGRGPGVSKRRSGARRTSGGSRRPARRKRRFAGIQRHRRCIGARRVGGPGSFASRASCGIWAVSRHSVVDVSGRVRSMVGGTNRDSRGPIGRACRCDVCRRRFDRVGGARGRRRSSSCWASCQAGAHRSPEDSSSSLGRPLWSSIRSSPRRFPETPRGFGFEALRPAIRAATPALLVTPCARCSEESTSSSSRAAGW